MQYTLSNQILTIRVDSLGAELQSLMLGSQEYVYQKQEGYWQRQSPILFPIVGALREGKYRYQDREYILGQHGFARDMEWLHVDTEREDALVFELCSTQKTRDIYPWDFRIELRYILESYRLRLEYTVENTSSEKMYFSLGGHPAFALDGNVEQYSLFFPGDYQLERESLDGGLLSGQEVIRLDSYRRLSLSESLFSRDALVFRFADSEEIVLEKNRKPVLYFDRGNFPHLGIWKQPSAPFLCIEPWHGYADVASASGEIVEKSGITSLEAGKKYQYFWSVSCV